jgi:hypothetical protein
VEHLGILGPTGLSYVMDGSGVVEERGVRLITATLPIEGWGKRDYRGISLVVDAGRRGVRLGILA